jgi:hypothetical protein
VRPTQARVVNSQLTPSEPAALAPTILTWGSVNGDVFSPLPLTSRLEGWASAAAGPLGACEQEVKPDWQV